MSENRPSQEASPSSPESSNTVFSPSSPSETKRLTKLLRAETTSGVLLVLAAAAALIWANSPAAPAYFDLRDFKIGPEALYLNLSLGSWAADGLLAIFFFLVGLELKREMVAGDLRSPSKALVPVAAAIGGVVVPAAIYIFLNRGNEEALNGWAIPTATDIAFAVAVLAIVGKGLPNPLRIFLLTLAVVDDLIAIAIIAIVYTADVNFLYLGLSLVPMTIFGLLVHLRPDVFANRRRHAWWLLLPLAFATWTLIHASGVHATIAGVLLGFIVPVSGRFGVELAEIFEHRFQPLSVAFAVPIFAFFSAGVAVGGFDGLVSGLTDPVAIGIIAALVIGKPVGIMLTTFLVTKLTSANLDSSVKWPDVLGVSALAGIGFTVSLLVTELSFPADSVAHDDAKVAILVASAIAAVGAGILLAFRGKKHQAQEQDSLYTS